LRLTLLLTQTIYSAGISAWGRLAWREWNDEYEKKKRAWEAHRKSVEILFSNENFFIAMLQVVSGATILMALSQADKLFRPGVRHEFRN
jgi:hypothetical protein